ncbi:MAG: hypothetical protein DRJ11_09065 [Candidatus Aminicenantes bacterium]|nr:MAG: hypothetical protein DRJ11_09065 [Candidatus Aminicenantes bacterium]
MSRERWPMENKKKFWPVVLIGLLFILSLNLLAAEVTFRHRQIKDFDEFVLANQKITLSITFRNKKLINEYLKARSDWLASFKAQEVAVETDGDFGLDLMWTGWRAPHKVNNAANPVVLTREDFTLGDFRVKRSLTGAVDLIFIFKMERSSLELRLVYRLQPDDFFARRRLEVRDPQARGHFLRWFWPRLGLVKGEIKPVKAGGFGQPVAVLTGQGGAFFGLEYPTAENHLLRLGQQQAELRCGQEMGARIGPKWLASEWVVAALTPTPIVKQWFWNYLETIKVAPARPYLLYNSWYDLRAPVMVKDQARALTEANVLKAVASFRQRLVKERGLKLDAFVLDDGWDVYRSDWQLNKEQFPNGLQPIAQALAAMGTRLGIWFGPIGGYSHRDWRLNWMKEHGYETVGNQLCVAGQKYHALLKKRVTDFVREYQVGYYKWDGIQFSCSEPDHGHLPGLYSRRAVMEAVIDLCRAVRQENPEIFLNITSGTWLSPWWLKYANTIWMQGSDYGYANVPSISRRDRAMTYRDDVLYEDLQKQDFWFPIAHLMTHGIIKGHLNQLGGPNESLEEFTDNALLYFARGISMWELYISPDFLSDEQWDVLAAAIRWAKDRFAILEKTEMVGGDPGEREPYAYVHFRGQHGLIAARNPFIEPRVLRIRLEPSLGISPTAAQLVVERKYPAGWVYPRLVKTGEDLYLPLAGYETAVYEIYPVEEADKPLLAGRLFEWRPTSAGEGELLCYPGQKEAYFLNPDLVANVEIKGESFAPRNIKLPPVVEPVKVEATPFNLESGVLNFTLTVKSPVKKGQLALLLEPTEAFQGQPLPEVELKINGQVVSLEKESQKGRWAWLKATLPPGVHQIQIRFSPAASGSGVNWQGDLAAWFLAEEAPHPSRLVCRLQEKAAADRPQPPRVWPAGVFHFNYKLGESKIVVQ